MMVLFNHVIETLYQSQLAVLREDSLAFGGGKSIRLSGILVDVFREQQSPVIGKRHLSKGSGLLKKRRDSQ
jgi:hypothetical protein